MQDVPAPFALAVAPLAKPAGQFGWALRRNGTLIERSDRPFLSEEKAYSAGLEAIERMLNPNAVSRRR